MMKTDRIEPPQIAPVSLSEAKAFLRLDTDSDDAQLAGLIRVALDLCDSFTGRTWLVTAWRQLAPARSSIALTRQPLVGVDLLTALSGVAEIGPVAVTAEMQVLDDDGRWQLQGPPVPPDATHWRVDYRAGEAASWNAVPEPVRQGVLRLVAHLYANRDAAADVGPPAAVTALWRPYRQLALG